MLGGLFVIRYDIVNITTQSGLDSGLIFGFYLNNIRYNTDDTFFFFLLLHDLLDAATVAVIPLGDIGQGFQFGLLLMETVLCLPQLRI